MKVTKNTFLEVFTLPEWDEKVISIVDFLGQERPKDEGAGTVFVNSKEHGLEMMFDYNIGTLEQKKIIDSGSLFLNQISFSKSKKNTPLPFDINIADSYKIAIEKIISSGMNMISRYSASIGNRILVEDKNKKYFIHLNFKDESFEYLEELVLVIYNENYDYSTLAPYKVDF